MDYLIFRTINNLAGTSKILDFIGIFFARYLIYLLFIVLIFFLFYKKRVVFKAILACLLGLIINYLISLFYFRPRPFVSFSVNLLIEKAPLGKSFPSDHATLAFALAFSIYFLNKKFGTIFFLLAFLVSLGRIFVGVHYPSDILASIIVAFFSSLIIKSLIKS